MTEQCPFCIEPRTEAAKQVYKWLVDTKEPIPQNRANYLQAYIRLGHRIDLVKSPCFVTVEHLPIEYPGDIEALLTMIEKKVETDE